MNKRKTTKPFYLFSLFFSAQIDSFAIFLTQSKLELQWQLTY